MTALAAPLALRVGWCPGALRPMRAGDGMLVRVKPRGLRLSFAQARTLADLAVEHGTGALTLTARGNVQLRGIAADRLPAVTDRLDAAALLDATPEGEAVRNVIANPLAGVDPAAPADLRLAVARLEESLAADPALAALPAKFSWSVDERGALPLDGIRSDVRFVAVADGRPRLLVGLDGAADHAVVHDDPAAVAGRLATAFRSLCAAHGIVPHRMRDLVAGCGAPAVLAAAGLMAGEAPPPALPRPNPIGVHRWDALSVVGAAPPFGLLDAATLMTLVDAAETAGAPDIRLTPWRSLLVPALSEAAASALAAKLEAAGLIVDPDDPRLTVAACIGQPGCGRATTPVTADAQRLAALRLGVPLHVSGCAKGCARREPAALTLVGRDGRYDLVRGGTAADPPVRTDLPLDALLALLPALVGEAGP